MYLRKNNNIDALLCCRIQYIQSLDMYSLNSYIAASRLCCRALINWKRATWESDLLHQVYKWYPFKKKAEISLRQS